jgi:hypothetical protein
MGPYDGVVAASVDRVGRNVRDTPKTQTLFAEQITRYTKYADRPKAEQTGRLRIISLYHYMSFWKRSHRHGEKKSHFLGIDSPAWRPLRCRSQVAQRKYHCSFG